MGWETSSCTKKLWSIPTSHRHTPTRNKEVFYCRNRATYLPPVVLGNRPLPLPVEVLRHHFYLPTVINQGNHRSPHIPYSDRSFRGSWGPVWFGVMRVRKVLIFRIDYQCNISVHFCICWFFRGLLFSFTRSTRRSWISFFAIPRSCLGENSTRLSVTKTPIYCSRSTKTER